MSNKYYTPTIEEFRVGFEYEYKLQLFNKLTKDFEDKWIKEAYGDSLEMFGDCYYLETVEGWINSTTCRVKYLDKQDIESLGFREDFSTSFETYFIKDKHEILFSDVRSTPPMLIIKKLALKDNQGNKTYMIKFQGTIKNKSELITLLRQLNIS